MKNSKMANVGMLAAMAVAGMFVFGCQSGKKDTAGGVDGSAYRDQIMSGEYISGDIPLYDGMRFETLNKVEDVNFYPVYFWYDTYVIPQNEIEKIAAIADFMNEMSDYLLVVEGHCDERGTNEYNMSLGEYRAQAVRDSLISCGVAPERIQTSSYGEEAPADPGHGESAWKLNRRAEFAFYTR